MTGRLAPPAWVAGLAVLAMGGYHLRGALVDRRRANELRAARPAGRPKLPSHPKVSILVAGWNEGPEIARHVESVLQLSYPSLEYVLCAGPSATHAAAARALGSRGVLLEQVPGEGKQRALRRCLAASSGEIVYLTDADCLLDDESFERTIEPIVRGEGAASGRCRPFADALAEHPSLLCQWAPEYAASARLGATSDGLQGGNCAVRRDLLERSGGFEADVTTGTDYHLARQLAAQNVPIAFARWSLVPTGMPVAVGAYLRRQSRWLRNHWVHGARTGDRAAQLHAVRTWTVGAVILLLPLASAVVGSWAVLAWLMLVLHGVLARVRYVLFVCHAEGLGWRPRALLLSPAWFALDVTAWLRSLVDALVPSLRARW